MASTSPELGGVAHPLPPTSPNPVQSQYQTPPLNTIQYSGGRRRVSYLLLVILPFISFAFVAVWAPRIEIFTYLVCKVFRPESADDRGTIFGHLGLNDRRKGCAADPVVQAAVSRLLAVLTVSSTVPSFITTSWWGSFSDRHGRNSALGISIFGLILCNLNVIFVSLFASHLPGNYWFLLVGYIIEGLSGGLTTINAAIQSHIVECTDPSSRSSTLTLIVGLSSAGASLGLTLSGLLIRISPQVLFVIYGTTLLLVCIWVVVLTLLPESLSQDQMLVNKRSYAAQQEGGSAWANILTFLMPLAILLPVRIETSIWSGRDWNLTWVAFAMAGMDMVLASNDVMFQYTSYVFGWTGEIISYWLGGLHVFHAVFLSLILPALIKRLKPTSPPIRLPIEPSESLSLPSASNDENVPVPFPSQMPSPERVKSTAFDISLARSLMLFPLATFVVMGLTTDPRVFVASSVIGAFGIGSAPALSNVALEVYMTRECHRRRGEGEHVAFEVGKLFGSLQIVQSLSVRALGPAVTSALFMFSVATFPGAVFLFCASGMLFSFLILKLVQLQVASSDTIGTNQNNSVRE